MSNAITRPDPEAFSSTIDNPYFTLRPGTTFVYEKPAAGEVVTVSVMHDTKVIDGVTCTVVHDVASVDGQVIEDTYDWYAQDAAGNVWYFGESTREFEPGNPNPISDAGTWQAGVNGAQPGIVMLAEPQPGDEYRQEFASGVAEDRASITSISAQAESPYGNFAGVLQTHDINPLAPSFEDKFYVRGVGEVLAIDSEGNRESLVKVMVDGGAGDDQLRGYAGGDQMHGEAGADTMRGDAGDDQMFGGRGADVLFGDDGADRLSGGRGDDMLTGGAGADIFVFNPRHDGAASTDTVVDYSAAEHDALHVHGGAQAVIAETKTGAGWELTLAGDGDVIRLLGVHDGNGDGHIVDDLIFA